MFDFAIENRTININRARKRMSNYSSCLYILTQLIGFEKSYNNGAKITLPDQVEIDTLVEFKNFVENSIENIDDNNDKNNQSHNNDGTSLWAYSHCTYNPIDINTCQMCTSPRNVCSLYVAHNCMKNQSKRRTQFV